MIILNNDELENEIKQFIDDKNYEQIEWHGSHNENSVDNVIENFKNEGWEVFPYIWHDFSHPDHFFLKFRRKNHLKNYNKNYLTILNLAIRRLFSKFFI